MNIARFSLSLSVLAGASSAFAGTFDIYANANAGEYDSSGLRVLASDAQGNAGHYSGVGSFGPVSASASVNDPTTGAFAVSTNQTVSANIVDELNGSISFSEGWTSNLLNQGYSNVYATTPGSSSISQYTFNSAGPGNLHLWYNASFSSTGGNLPGFGLWNTVVYVDGTAYYPTDPNAGWVTPLSSGSWNINLASGGPHTIGFMDFSNVSGGMMTESMQLNETVNFSVGATPEPASIAALGIGAVGLLRRKRRKV